jgi:hypothetical protein
MLNSVRTWSRARIVIPTLVYVTVILIGLVTFGSNWLSYRRLAMEGRATVATVVETTCWSHATFLYQFKVNDRVYRDGGRGGHGNPECSKLKSGDVVNVWYLPVDPNQSVAGDPRQWQRNEAVTILIGNMWFGVFYVICIWREVRRNRR